MCRNIVGGVCPAALWCIFFCRRKTAIFYGERRRTNLEKSKEYAIFLLKEKQKQTGRNPVRNDFTDTEVMTIKSYLGPWPRALEAAGLKEPKPVDRLTVNRMKRLKKKEEQRNRSLSRNEKTEELEKSIKPAEAGTEGK